MNSMAQADVDDTKVTPLRPTNRVERPSPNALRQRKFRKKQKRKPVTPSVTLDTTVTPPPTVTEPTVTLVPALPATPSAGIDVAAYMAAIALASVAALFSVKGMVQLFPGTPMLIICMAVAMEGSKLVAAGWLARRWRMTAWAWRLTLVVLIFGLATINATGVYAQLVAAHVGKRGAAQSTIEMQDATLTARIDVQAHMVTDLPSQGPAPRALGSLRRLSKF
jgi:hypothetical protein